MKKVYKIINLCKNESIITENFSDIMVLFMIKNWENSKYFVVQKHTEQVIGYRRYSSFKTFMDYMESKQEVKA